MVIFARDVAATAAAVMLMLPSTPVHAIAESHYQNATSYHHCCFKLLSVAFSLSAASNGSPCRPANSSVRVRVPEVNADSTPSQAKPVLSPILKLTSHHMILMHQPIQSPMILIQRLLVHPRIPRRVLFPIPLIPAPLVCLGWELRPHSRLASSAPTGLHC